MKSGAKFFGTDVAGKNYYSVFKTFFLYVLEFW
jgi:hypothetical protein